MTTPKTEIETSQPPPRPARKNRLETLGKATPDSPDHRPRAGTLPQDLENRTTSELEKRLLHIEHDILAAEIQAADERRMSQFMTGPGLAFVGATVPLAIADFEQMVLVIVGGLGLVLFTIGSLSIRPAKRDAALTARNFDRDRIVRAIDRQTSDGTNEEPKDPKAVTSGVETNNGRPNMRT